MLAGSWLVGITIIDLSAGPALPLGALYGIAPLIACAALPPAATAGFAVVAVALGTASGWWNHTATAAFTTVRLLDLVLVSTAAIVVATVRVRREARLARVVAIAEVAQAAILPVIPARVGVVAAAARYEAADSDALVGGDFYDCYSACGLTRFVLGDVRGKGTGAVGQAARAIRAFRQAAATAATLPAVAEAMSNYIARFLDSTGEEFVTALLVEVTDSRAATVVACGHPAPLLITDAGVLSEPTMPPGLPLGWGETYKATRVRWSVGDRLLLFTDGLEEAREAAGGFFPLHTHALQLAIDSVDTAADKLLTTLRRYVPAGDLHDDLALVLLENTGIDAGPADSVARPALVDLTTPPAPRPALSST